LLPSWLQFVTVSYYDMKTFHARLREKRPKLEAMGVKFVSEAEAEAMRNRR